MIVLGVLRSPCCACLAPLPATAQLPNQPINQPTAHNPTIPQASLERAIAAAEAARNEVAVKAAGEQEAGARAGDEARVAEQAAAERAQVREAQA